MVLLGLVEELVVLVALWGVLLVVFIIVVVGRYQVLVCFDFSQGRAQRCPKKMTHAWHGY